MRRIEAHLCSNDFLIRPYSVFLCSRCKKKNLSMNVFMTEDEISEYNSGIRNKKVFDEWKKKIEYDK